MDLLDGMRSFVAVVESGSFTAAGARLGISNKLVSKYVASLEQKLGASLLHRTTRTLSLTEAGERYLGGARTVLNAVDMAQAELLGTGGMAGRLRVAAPLTFGESFVTDATRSFLKLYAEVEIELHLSDQVVDLAQGGFDLAIRIGNLRDSSLKTRRLGETTMRVVASPDYLKLHGVPRHPDELADHTCIRDTNAATYNHWRFMVDGNMVQLPVSGPFSANSASACLALARAGEGLFICPDIFLSEDLANGTLQQILQDYPSEKIAIQMVRLPSGFSGEKCDAFMGVLASEFAKRFS